VNNEVGPLPIPLQGQTTGYVPGFTTSFNVHGLRPGSVVAGETVTPSSPLAFTSAFPKRQIQLGLRVSF
jgi:hypothetical protein